MKKKAPTEKEIIAAFEKYKEHLFNSKTISATKFSHMQSGIYGCKQIIHDLFGSDRTSETAWIK